MVASLCFRAGTIELRGVPRDQPQIPALLEWDERAACFRAPAIAYVEVLTALREAAVDVEDDARRDADLGSGARVHREPRPFQTEALQAWRAAGGRGVVVLPTGSGKTHVAVLVR